MDDTALPTVIVPLAERDVLDGKWALVRKVAEGASGAVYLAQEQGTERPVAVKILSPLLCRNQKILGRFEREARQLAALNHPNVIKLLSVGRSGAQPFIVMPFIDGSTLAQHLRTKGRLSSEEALIILRQLCAGLGYLHAQGLVHRDVKPGNVMVAVNGHVTLLDLGVVREKGAPPLTAPGARLGTPNYMAPEQIEASHDVDHRADLYSLGAVAFELLTGSPPFRGANMRELMEQHRLAAPPNAAHLVASVSRATADVLQLALAKTPQERYQSARHFMDALERAMAPFTQRHPAAPARNRLMVSGEDSLSGGQSITQAATVPNLQEDAEHTFGSTASTAVSASSTSPPTVSSTQPPPRPAVSAARPQRSRAGLLWYAAAGVALGAAALVGLAAARGEALHFALPDSLAALLDPGANGVLEVVAEPGAPPATVLVDGAPRGDTPLRLALPPGTYRVLLLRPGDPELEREVVIAPRQEVHLAAPAAR